MNETFQVNMAEIVVTKNPNILACLGLGSCVAVTLYDPFIKIGGLAHVVLPNSLAVKNNANLKKFANTAIDMMLHEMLSRGASKKKIQAKIFGGANMFTQIKTQFMRVGDSNINAVQQELKKQNIPILAKDVGGNFGRSIYFQTQTGQVLMRVIKDKNERIF